MKRKSKKTYKPFKLQFISYDDPKVQKFIAHKIYESYLNDFYTDKDMEKVDCNHFENAFSDKIHYLSMKNIPIIEKKILYYDIYCNETFESICKRLNLTKMELITYHKLGLEHFKKNVEMYKKIYGKGGNLYE